MSISKCIAAGTLGFILGVNCRVCCKKISLRKAKRQAMRLMGL